MQLPFFWCAYFLSNKYQTTDNKKCHKIPTSGPCESIWIRTHCGGVVNDRASVKMVRTSTYKWLSRAQFFQCKMAAIKPGRIFSPSPLLFFIHSHKTTLCSQSNSSILPPPRRGFLNNHSFPPRTRSLGFFSIHSALSAIVSNGRC